MMQISSTKIYTSGKIISLAAAASVIRRLRQEGKTVGLCHGGFDLLHPGHVKHFESAKKLCDVLVVSVTSDRFVEGRKGAGRPIFPDTLRAYMIANLRMVDYVVVTDVKLGVDVINALKPSMYMKGPDFIGKQTPGITSEREAIKAVGGTMAYTDDPKLSTTEVIDYIQQKIPSKRLLVVLDRDGTLITNDDFLGRTEDWKKKITLNMPVVSFLSYMQTKYKTTKIVVSNQSGVARGYFDEKKVDEVNEAVNDLLKKQGIKIDSWQYCPDVDAEFVGSHPEIAWKTSFVKKTTKRKPSPAMVTDALFSLGKKMTEFDKVVVLGNSDDDNGLAQSINAKWIDVRGASYEALLAVLGTIQTKS
ncbi:MAG: HAD-IIIA family hydrolase [Candidatus Gottesmanbacteria bacterium]|nr:HAD-IIIA family hydrolase [Candidatus Gottesmanbacteria bacterium]